MDNMKELYKKVAGDTALQKKFIEIMKDAETAGAEVIVKRLIAFAGDEGFEVTPFEVQEFFRNLSQQESGVLSEDELDAVAGGKGGVALFVSVLGYGVGCGIASALAEVAAIGCSDLLSKDIVVK